MNVSRWRPRRLPTLCLTVGLAAATACGLGAAPASADDCANAEFRVGPSAKLPDCRAYEQVTPADKDTYGLMLDNDPANDLWTSAGGNGAYYGVITPFADPISGSPGDYVSRRSEDGWETRNIVPDPCVSDPSGIIGTISVVTLAADFSAAVMRAPRSDCDPDDHGGTDLYLRPWDLSSFDWLSHDNAPKLTDDGANFVGASDGLDHVLFTTNEKLVLPLEADRNGRGLYDRTGGRAIPVGLDDGGDLINPCGLQDVAPQNGTAGVVSGDGRVIFFQAGASSSVPECDPATGAGGQLYARVDHERTVMVSPSLLAVPEARQEPTFMGATSDGSRVFFRTTERLTDDATAGGGLYVYDLSEVLSGSASEGELSFLTPPVGGGPAEIVANNLAAFSEDGRRAYFLARGELAAGAPPSGVKLYGVDEHGEVTYISPSSFNNDATTIASASPDGSKLAFQHTPSGGVQQVNLYDLETGSVTCVSCPSDGSPQVDEARIVVATGTSRPGYQAPRRHVTDDGRVFFNALDQLVAKDVNSKFDVYEYEDGEHKLLSPGTSPYDSMLWGVSTGGRDVFLTTNDSLVAGDFDNGDQDLYVARVGGGFPQPAPDRAVCSGDACQGAPPAAPAGSAAASAGFRGAGNATRRQVVRVALVKRRLVTRGRATWLRFRVSESGRVAVGGRGIARSSKRVRKAGAQRVRVRLSKAGRRVLRRRGRVAVRVLVRLRTEGGQVRRARGRIVFRASAKRRAVLRAKRAADRRAAGRKGGR